MLCKVAHCLGLFLACWGISLTYQFHAVTGGNIVIDTAVNALQLWSNVKVQDHLLAPWKLSSGARVHYYSVYVTRNIPEEVEIVVIEHSVCSAAEHDLCGVIDRVSTSVRNRNGFSCLTEDGG